MRMRELQRPQFARLTQDRLRPEMAFMATREREPGRSVFNPDAALLVA
jgi:hypothetical protein